MSVSGFCVCNRQGSGQPGKEVTVITPRNSIYVFVAAFSVAVVACQPSEGPAERIGKDVDRTAKKVGKQVDKAADKAKESISDAKK